MKFAETNEHKQALAKAKNALVLDLPFYSVIALMLPTTYDPALPTAGTNGSWIKVNPEWFMAMRHRQRVGLLCHEVEHVVRLHSWRIKGRDPEIWNDACDAVINHSIRRQGMELPEGGVEFDWVTDESTEEGVYQELLNRGRKPQPRPGQGQPEEGAGQSGSGQAGEPWSGDLHQGEQSGEAETKAKELGKSAAAMAKAMGKLPAHMKGLIDAINESKTDYRTLMASWMAELAQLDASWSRPNRTWLTRGVRLPGVQSEEALGELGIVLDQSGSMNTEEIRQSFGEVVKMVATTNPRKVIVVYLDSAVADVDVFTNPSAAEIRKSASRRASGGTDMTVGLDYLEKRFPNLAGAVVLTDGYTPFGKPRDFPTMWAITTPGVTADWGTTVPIEVGDDRAH